MDNMKEHVEFFLSQTVTLAKSWAKNVLVTNLKVTQHDLLKCLCLVLMSPKVCATMKWRSESPNVNELHPADVYSSSDFSVLVLFCTLLIRDEGEEGAVKPPQNSLTPYVSII